MYDLVYITKLMNIPSGKRGCICPPPAAERCMEHINTAIYCCRDCQTLVNLHWGRRQTQLSVAFDRLTMLPYSYQLPTSTVCASRHRLFNVSFRIIGWRRHAWLRCLGLNAFLSPDLETPEKLWATVVYYFSVCLITILCIDKRWCALFRISTCSLVLFCFVLFFQTTDTEGYDEYVEGVEPDETTSLETPIKEVILMDSGMIRTSDRLKGVN